MSRRFAKHNRFAEELDTPPSRLEELTLDRRPLERDESPSSWLRNLVALAVLIVLGLILTALAN